MIHHPSMHRKIHNLLLATIHTEAIPQDDTIYALSSGHSVQATAVALIRISGPDSSSILQTLSQCGKLPPPRKAVVRKLFDNTDGSSSQLDQALVLWFPGPRSFTGQDSVELHCHGSRAVVQGVLSVLGTMARLAEPGEFTQRALLHNKMNVLQVEALADLLAADTATQRKQALAQLEGETAAIFTGFREQLIGGLAHAEAVIDFGDDELDVSDDQPQESVWGGVRDKMEVLRRSMEKELSSRGAELVREGVKIAIVGPPNAGKSSLFNRLADRDAAIVSSQAGTTRDVLEVALDLGGTKCVLQDTAGVREETTDTIEKEGMQRALSAAARADLIVVLVDATETNSLETLLPTVLQQREEENTLIVRNKADLLSDRTTNEGAESSSQQQHDQRSHMISCLTDDGIDSFLQSLTKRVTLSVGKNDGLITRARHRQHVQAAVEALERFDTLSHQGYMAIDMAAEELRLASSELGRITGAVDVEDVLDKLFADFCIGK